MNVYLLRLVVSVGVIWPIVSADLVHADHLKNLQREAITSGAASWGHWGADARKYSAWLTHTNRLIPIYTFGMTLDEYTDSNSVYRDAGRIEKLYGRVPQGTLNPDADYCDQTDLFLLQEAAIRSGKKYIVLIVFDGMDWQTTWAAATFAAGKVGYSHGRGTGLHFQDYRGTLTDYGYCVAAPFIDQLKGDTDTQQLAPPARQKRGGYDWRRAGSKPWTTGNDPLYVMGTSRSRPHPYPDSSSTATAMMAGIKTYNRSVNVDPQGRQVVPIARRLQEKGLGVGVVTSVPISHATPACAFANNVYRFDHQDLARDLVGLPSVAHPERPLPGVDVLLGAGWGESFGKGPTQGSNYVPGNVYIADNDVERIDAANGGPYRVVTRMSGVDGAGALEGAARDAIERDLRLFGLFGARGGARPGAPGGHLPFRTADGRYDPTLGALNFTEKYSDDDIRENPTLANMTAAALSVLEQNPRGFWLMVEAGDVDWANHQNNLDSAIGAVQSGDEAFREVTHWAEHNDAWDELLVIVTADHGHYFVLDHPEALIPPKNNPAPSR